jgi:tyrosyl-tRNA synthetase
MLATEIVKIYHGEKEADEAKGKFENTFQNKNPEYDTKIVLENSLTATIVPHTSKKSASEAKRLIAQGAVSVNGEKITDPTFKIKTGDKIKVGSHTFGTVEK